MCPRAGDFLELLQDPRAWDGEFGSSAGAVEGELLDSEEVVACHD